MEYRGEELARQAGVRVDTIRFYQGRGLLPAPARRGRVAIYEEGHLERLRRIRAWQREGLSLAVIKRLLEADDPGAVHETLLRAIVQERLGGRTLSRAELAAESNVPEPLIRAVEAAGLVEPIRIGEEERFTEADLEMARAGLAILHAGFPLDELLQLAVQHAQNVQGMADRAIGLFDRHVRGGEATLEQAPDAVAHAFRVLLPQVTRLVALHFQRTVVKRALERLARGDDAHALNSALEAVESSRLEVTWR
jgi:DNA-binding transcriptional MerR regulator